MIPIQDIYYFLGTMMVIISLGIWITAQFNKIRDLVSKSYEKIMNKLEYHERHDDERFNQLNADLVAIRLRNASKDVMMQDILDDIKVIVNGKKSIGRNPEGS